MHANLMSSASSRNGANQAEAVTKRCRFDKAALRSKLCQCRGTLRVNHLFEPDRRVLMFTLAIQRSVNNFVLPSRPAPNDCNVLLVQLVSLHQESKIARGSSGFCNQHQTAGFAVESVHDGDLSAAGDLECEQLTQL